MISNIQIQMYIGPQEWILNLSGNRNDYNKRQSSYLTLSKNLSITLPLKDTEFSHIMVNTKDFTYTRAV